MFGRTSGFAFLSTLSRSFATGPKVAVLGAAGGIGQPLSLLLKESSLIGVLSLYDVAPITPGVAADLSHIDTASDVVGYAQDGLAPALKGSHVVVIPAGVPRKPGMTRDDLFNTNASIVRDLVKGVAENCPEAHILIIANPVNSTVPIAAEVLKKAGVYNPKRLFGVTTLDVVRANRFVAELRPQIKLTQDVNVIGGHAGKTILPLLSQVSGANWTKEELDALTHRIQFAGDEVVKAKAGGGSATLSMAYAAARFTFSLLRALKGESGIVENAYVESNVDSKIPFFSSPLLLGKEGVQEIRHPGKISDYEQKLWDELRSELVGSIDKGIQFAAK